MKFEIVEICEAASLRAREQFYIDTLKPNLNVSLDARHAVWGKAKADPVFAEKMQKVYKENCEALSRPVDSDCGMSFPSMNQAALFYGVDCSQVRGWAISQIRSKRGIRLKFRDANWSIEISLEDRKKDQFIRMIETRRLNGRMKPSAECLRKKSAALKGKPWSEKRRAAYAKGRAKYGAPA